MWNLSNARKSVLPVIKFAHWWRKISQARLAELEGCGADEVERIARDIGVTAYELRLLAGKNPGAAHLLERRIEALHIDQAELRRAHPMVLRDLEKTCSLCEDHIRCEADFAKGTANSLWQEYCPNALTLCELVAATPEPSDLEALIEYLNTIGTLSVKESVSSEKVCDSSMH
jgi:hypothetical protein